MIEFTRGFRRLALSATISMAVLCAVSMTAATAAAEGAGQAKPRSVAAQAAHALVREKAAFEAIAADRVETLALERAERPVPRDRVTIATRGSAPEAQIPVAARAPQQLDFAAIDAMPRVTGDAQWACLAEAVYFESRGEPLAGQIAVAEVVLNRVDSRSYPNTVCAVTNQGVGAGRSCQFSYACDGRPDVMRSAVAKQRAEKLARMLLDGRPRSVTDGATHFHATYVRPGWARSFARTAAIGQHVFYRQPTRLASN